MTKNRRGPAPHLKTKDSNFAENSRFLSAGFTLIEMLVVFTITILIVLSLLSNVLKSRLNIQEVVRITISDIRTAQANTLASKQFIDPSTGLASFRCGFGLSHDNGDTTGYFLYAGADSTTGNCGSARQFGNSTDTPIFTTRILDSRLETIDDNNFKDIYFESPDGKIYIKNQHNTSNENQNKSRILIRKKGASCPSSNCVYICVYASGKIESRTTDCTNF